MDVSRVYVSICLALCARVVGYQGGTGIGKKDPRSILDVN